MPDSQTALVTGANGFIGSHLCRTLAGRGYRIKALVRQTSNLRFLDKADCELVYGDLSQPQSFTDYLKDIDYVFHPAGLVRASSLERFMQVNRGGTRNLMREVHRQAPNLKRVVHISSQAAGGPAQTETPVDEAVIPQPVSWYGQSKLASEEAALEFGNDLPITIIRPPAVYGPRDIDVLKFYKLVKAGVNLKLGFDSQYVSLVHVTDLVDCIIQSAENDQARGEIFYACNPDYYKVDDVLGMISEIMHKSYIDIAIPMPVARALALVLKHVCHVLKIQPPFSKDKLKEFSQKYWICSPIKAEKMLGWKAKISIAEGLAQTYNWYNKEGWL